MRRVVSIGLFVGIAVAFYAAMAFAAGLSPEIEKGLRESQYVYIATQRKSGSFGAKAEIWFFFHDGAVWVGTTPESWKAKRIRAGRPAAKIYVGKPDGPVLDATGSFVKDEKMEELLCQTYAKKYPDGWQRHEQRFRQGFADGSRVLIKYTPK